ncbi:MAG: lactate utilization protein C [Alicyclobacillaceae bacterium]|nr:lactate utilization protein C [Alicyclobacillaceae bacterium]
MGEPPRDGDQRELVEQFIANWTALGGEAEIAVSARAAEKIVAFLGNPAGRTVVRWNDPLLEELALDEHLKRLGAEVYVWKAGADRDRIVEIAERADLGITAAHFAAAEPGTVVLLSGGDTARSVSLLPPAHLAVVPVSRLVPGLAEVMRELGRHRLPSSVNLITGPSRTADIENDLTVGVHGPGRVGVLFLEDR